MTIQKGSRVEFRAQFNTDPVYRGTVTKVVDGVEILDSLVTLYVVRWDGRPSMIPMQWRGTNDACLHVAGYKAAELKVVAK